VLPVWGGGAAVAARAAGRGRQGKSRGDQWAGPP
jgi:hypothetical protein